MSRRERRAAERENERRLARARRVALPIYPGEDVLPRRQLREDVTASFDGRRSLPAVAAGAERAGTAVDGILAQAFARTGAPACRRGCAYCCYTHVTLTIPELAVLARHVAGLEPASRDALRERARVSSAAARGHTPGTYPSSIACALLVDGACSAYASRPINCRRAHSTDAEACREGHAANDPAFGIPHFAIADRSTHFALVGYLEALEHAKLDGGPYELQQALHLALEDETRFAAWLRGEPAFAAAKSLETEEELSAIGAKKNDQNA